MNDPTAHPRADPGMGGLVRTLRFVLGWDRCRAGAYLVSARGGMTSRDVAAPLFEPSGRANRRTPRDRARRPAGDGWTVTAPTTSSESPDYVHRVRPRRERQRSKPLRAARVPGERDVCPQPPMSPPTTV